MGVGAPVTRAWHGVARQGGRPNSPRMRRTFRYLMDKHFQGSAKVLSEPLFYSYRAEARTKKRVPTETLKVATWNILAPPYHRRTTKNHETSKSRLSKASPGTKPFFQFLVPNKKIKSNQSSTLSQPAKKPAEQALMADWTYWRERVEHQIDLVEQMNLDILFLQEFWCEPEFISLWRAFCERNELSMFVSKRTDRKCDGCCTIIDESKVTLSENEESILSYSYNDWGNRVCLVVNASVEMDETRTASLALLNTHLTFAHQNGHDPVQRFHQARKLAEILWNQAPVDSESRPGYVLLGGDLNGDLEDEAMKNFDELLREPMDEAASAVGEFCLHRTDSSWISHRTHLGDYKATDYFVFSKNLTLENSKLVGTLEGSTFKADVETEQELSDHLLVFANCRL